MEFEKVNVKSVYEEIAPYFQKTRTYVWDWIPGFIRQFPNTSIICDVGCGTGRNMLKNHCKFVGIDNCANLPKICENAGNEVLLSDMCCLPLNDSSVDGILSIASFHHLKTVDRRKLALHEMRRILKPGGKVLLSVWSINQPQKTRRIFTNYCDVMVPWDQKGTIYSRYYYIFQIDELKNLIVEAGFMIKSHVWNCGNEVFELTKVAGF